MEFHVVLVSIVVAGFRFHMVVVYRVDGGVLRDVHPPTLVDPCHFAVFGKRGGGRGVQWMSAMESGRVVVV